MDEKDIRIGNSLLLYGEVVKVTEIGFRNNDYYLRVEWNKNGYYLDQFEPIILTEEILLKCGFEKSTDIDCYDINKLDNVIIYSIKGLYQVIKYSRNNTNDYHLSISDTNDYCEYGYYVHTSKEIKHLHQLQNLYYCLVGTELEIEL